MLAHACAGCGVTFAATSPRARWCSEKCRKRAARRGGGAPSVRLQAAPEPKGPEHGAVETATLEDLEKAGRTRTVPGRIALLLARRLDENSGDTGSSVAAVARELKATMELALAGAKEAPDPLDVIRARRVLQIAEGGVPDYAGRGRV